MFFWLWEVIVWIALTVTAYYLTPRPKRENARAGALSDFNFPTIEEGTPIPVLRGTGLLRAPIIGWLGGFYTQEFKDHDVVLGYHYHLGLDLFFCHGPVDELLEIRFDDKFAIRRNGGSVPANCVLRVEDLAGVHDVVVTPGAFNSMSAMATAVASSIRGVVPTFGRVVYDLELSMWCYYNGTAYANFVYILFCVTINGFTFECGAWVPTGAYTDGTSLALALNKAIEVAKWEAAEANSNQDIQALNLEFTYDVMEQKFTMNVGTKGPTITAFWLEPFSNLLPYLGIQHDDPDDAGADPVWLTTSFPESYTAEHTSCKGYFYFDINPGITVHWPESNQVARDTFGKTLLADQTAQGLCEAYREVGSLGFETFADYGDSIGIGINLPELYGGTKGGGAGGVWGWMQFFKGTQGQDGREVLAGRQADPRSGYPGIAHLVTADFVWGIQTTFRNVSAVMRCTPNPLGLAIGPRIGDDYNPGLMLWELCTDEVWGAAISPDLLDRDAFVTLALACAAEGLGGTWIFDQGRPATELAEDVCRQINAMPVVNPLTGKLGFQLVRADYDVNSIPEVNESQLSNIKFSRPSWGKTKTSVMARFIDRARGYIEDSRTVHNEAAIAAQNGRIEVEEIDCPGLTTGPAASRAAWGQLAPASYPFAILEADCDRTLWRALPGEVFAFTSERLGITKMPMRTCTLNTGSLESGKLSVQAAEDVFGLQMIDGDDPNAIPPVTPIAFFVGGDYDDWKPIAQAIGPNGQRLWPDEGLNVFAGTFDGSLAQVQLQTKLDGNGRRWLVADGDGGFYYVCLADPGSGNSERIWAQRMSANGVRLWGDGIEVFDGIGFDSMIGCLCGVSLGAHGLMVVWTACAGGADQIRAQRISKAGVLQLETNGVVGYNTTGAARVQDAVANGAGDGGVYVTFLSDLPGGVPADIELNINGERIGSSLPLGLFTEVESGDVLTEPDGGRGTGSLTMENATCTSFTRLQRAYRAVSVAWGEEGVSPGKEAPPCETYDIDGCSILSDDAFGLWFGGGECRDATRSGGGMQLALRISSMGTPVFKTDLGLGGWWVYDIALDLHGGAYFVRVDMGPDPAAEGDFFRGHVHRVLGGGHLEWSDELDRPEDEDDYVVPGFAQHYSPKPVTVPDGSVAVAFIDYREEMDDSDNYTLKFQRWSRDGEKLWGDHGVLVFPGRTDLEMYLVCSPRLWQAP